MNAKPLLLLTGCAEFSSRTAEASNPSWRDFYLSPGIVWSWSKTPEKANGTGFELTAGYTFLLASRDGVRAFFLEPNVGLLYRNHSYRSRDYHRQVFGVQGGIGPFGLEIGYADRGASASLSGRSGFHLAPFFSLGVLYCGPQWTLTDRTPEFSFNFALKLPMPFSLWRSIARGDFVGWFLPPKM